MIDPKKILQEIHDYECSYKPDMTVDEMVEIRKKNLKPRDAV